ncbi:MAG TPA: NADH-quinone oxidoreductase subunit N [Clostridia bacterium]|nr:NADH-quinone oxidoreductase subunit N [Clostridia bacterium]
MLMNLSLLTLEIVVATLALFIFILGLVAPANQKRGIGYFTVLSLVVSLIIAIILHGESGTAFGTMYVVDPFSSYFKIAFLIAAVLVTMFSISYVNKLGYNQGEFFALTVLALLGMMIMSSAADFITFYLGLEMMTIPFIILTAFRYGDKASSEAGMKYMLLSAMSSAVLLYGLSILYGAAGSTLYSDVINVITGDNIDALTVIGLVFLLAGFGFKISMVPFHMWSPDIYQGAPTPVTAFLAIGSKAAALAAMIRMFMIALPETREVWMTLVIVLCAMTIVLGNFVAIPQTNIKRMLAYSSIAHAGYLLMGLVAFTNLGISAILYYVMIYVFANAGAFACVNEFGNMTGSDEIKDYTGMWKRSPLIASVMLLCLLSLGGIPPLAGFVGKFYLFTAIIDQGYIWLAFLGIGMSMVSVYYYLIVVKVMFLGKPVEETSVPVSLGAKTVMFVSAVASLFLGLYPAPLTDIATKVAQLFFPM